MISSEALSSLESHFSVLQNERSRVVASLEPAAKPPLSRAASLTLSTSSMDIEKNIIQVKPQVAGEIEPQGLSANNPTWRFFAAFGCLCVVNLVCALDATILSVALPTIATALKGSAIEAFWTGTSYLLTSTVFQPSWASMSHIIGRKPVLLIAVGLFFIGAIVASTANNFSVMIGGRCIQGVGGGGIVALTYVIVTDMVTLRERGKWFSFISAQWALGAATGPIIGGAFAEKTTWRWIYWLNIPFCILAFVCIPIFLRLNHKVGGIREKLKKFDWVGSALFVGSLTTFLIPLTWGGVMYDWISWRTLVPLIIGPIGLLAFVAWSKYGPCEPLIRASIFEASTARVGYFGTTMHGIIVWSLLYYLPLYFEVGKGFTAIKSGTAVFPITLTIGPAVIGVGLIITKTGRFRSSIWLGWFLTTIGLGLLVTLKTTTSTLGWIFLSLVTGIGTGMLYSAQSFAVQACASNSDLPFAGAMYSFFRSLGQTFGVGIGGVIFENIFKQKLLASTNPWIAATAEVLAKDASALVLVVKQMPAGALRDELVTAYVNSVRVIWVVMCVFAGVTLLASLVWTKDVSLDRELETEQGFRHEIKVVDPEA